MLATTLREALNVFVPERLSTPAELHDFYVPRPGSPLWYDVHPIVEPLLVSG